MDKHSHALELSQCCHALCTMCEQILPVLKQDIISYKVLPYFMIDDEALGKHYFSRVTGKS